MADVNGLVMTACGVVFLASVVFIYLLSVLSSYVESQDERLDKRIADWAAYLSKLEEETGYVRDEVRKKVGRREAVEIIRERVYDNALSRILVERKR